MTYQTPVFMIMQRNESSWLCFSFTAKFKTSVWHRASSQKCELNEWKNDCCTTLLLSLPFDDFFFHRRILLNSLLTFTSCAHKGATSWVQFRNWRSMENDAKSQAGRNLDISEWVLGFPLIFQARVTFTTRKWKTLCTKRRHVMVVLCLSGTDVIILLLALPTLWLEVETKF